LVADRLEQDDWAASDEDLRSLVSQATTAVDADPTDADHRYWLSVYKWRSIDHPPPATQPAGNEDYTPSAPATQPAVPEINVADLQPLDHSTPATQPAEPAVAQAAPPPPGPTTLPTGKFPQAREIVAELLETRRLCPTFGPLYSVAGQIRYFALNDPAGADEVELGYQLTRDHPITCFAAGLVDGKRGNWDAARDKFRHAIALGNGKLIPELVNASLYRLDRPELPIEVTADRLDWFCFAAKCLADDGRHEEVANKACAMAVQRLKTQGLPVDLRALGNPESAIPAIYSTAGEACQHQREYGMAIQYYEQSLALDYGNIWSRYRLAQCLFATDRKQEAAHEARICLRFNPNMGEARRIIMDSAAPLDVASENN
jgi:tetratricopeptide (TPR) repeat protein